jgi:hypothetical protein
LKIFGDGSQTRVFCHVSDSVRAVLALASNDKTIGEVFNIGGREELNITDLAKKIINLTQSISTITYTPYEDAYAMGYEDMARRVPDLTKIKKYIESVDSATNSVHQKNWSIQDCSESILKQDDGHSCGYFTCWYAYDHVMGGSATCTKLKDIKETTKMIKETVMCSTLADDIIPFEF